MGGFSVPYGLRFKTSNLIAIHERIMAWRAVIAEKARDKQARWFATEVIDDIDRAAAKGETIEHPLSKVSNDFREKRKEIEKGYRQPQVDWEFKLTLMPYRRRVYGKINTEHEAWAEEFMTVHADIVEDYSYWDTDEPTVSMSSWKRRRKLWDEMTRRDPWRRFSGVGLVADCTPPEFHSTEAEIVARIPDLETRVRQMGRKLAMDDRYAIYPLEERRHMSNAIGILMEVEDWIKDTPEGRKAVSDKMDVIRPLLPTPVTEFMILGFERKEPL